MWDHIYRLADMLASTKECVEDTFGAGVDMGRGNKNPFSAGTIDRLHHLQSFWVRLDSSEWPKVRPVLKQQVAKLEGDAMWALMPQSLRWSPLFGLPP